MVYFGGSKRGLTGLLPRSWRAEQIDTSEGKVPPNTAKRGKSSKMVARMASHKTALER